MKKYIRLLTYDELQSRMKSKGYHDTLTDSQHIYGERSHSMQGSIAVMTDEMYTRNTPLLRTLENGSHRGGRKFILSEIAYDVIDIASIPVENRLFSLSFFDALVSMLDKDLIHELIKLSSTDAHTLDMRNIGLNKKGFMTYYTHGHTKEKTIKIGRGLIKLLTIFNLKDTCTPSIIESVTNALKAVSLGSSGISVIEGDAMLHYYSEQSYDWESNLGSLGKSCMRNDKCQKFLQFYVDNKDICKLLVYSKPSGTKGKITARALLWKIDGGEFFMDRVYGNDTTQVLFKQYAKDKGYLYKSNQSFKDKDLIIVNDAVETREMRITLKKSLSSYTYYPYLDTFTYDAGDNAMVNVDTYVEIGKFDDIHGKYKHFTLCNISKRKAFNDLNAYRGIDNNMYYALNEYLVESGNSDMIDKSLAKRTLNGGWEYEHRLVFLKSQNGWCTEESVFTCDYDSKKYCNVINNNGHSVRAYINTGIGMVHVMNYNFLTEEQMAAKSKKKVEPCLSNSSTSSGNTWASEASHYRRITNAPVMIRDMSWSNTPVTSEASFSIRVPD